jgi:hypothetical protein
LVCFYTLWYVVPRKIWQPRLCPSFSLFHLHVCVRVHVCIAILANETQLVSTVFSFVLKWGSKEDIQSKRLIKAFFTSRENLIPHFGKKWMKRFQDIS